MAGRNKTADNFRVPYSLIRDTTLSADERFLLVYFLSNNPKTWVYHINKKVLPDLGWGEEKYRKIVKRLDQRGLIRSTQIRKKDEASGKAVNGGVKIEVTLQNQTLENQGSENVSDPRKSGASKSGALSTEIDKGRIDPEVIDETDTF